MEVIYCCDKVLFIFACCTFGLVWFEGNTWGMLEPDAIALVGLGSEMRDGCYLYLNIFYIIEVVKSISY